MNSWISSNNSPLLQICSITGTIVRYAVAVLWNFWSENKTKSTNLPEPHDLPAGPGVVPVDGMALPVVQINLLHPTQKHLQGRKRKRSMWVQPWLSFCDFPQSNTEHQLHPYLEASAMTIHLVLILNFIQNFYDKKNDDCSWNVFAEATKQKASLS